MGCNERADHVLETARDAVAALRAALDGFHARVAAHHPEHGPPPSTVHRDLEALEAGVAALDADARALDAAIQRAMRREDAPRNPRIRRAAARTRLAR